eukprot:429176-Pyramimonas_sp.AAC.1
MPGSSFVANEIAKMLDQQPPTAVDHLKISPLPDTAEASSRIAMCSTVVMLRGVLDSLLHRRVHDHPDGHLNRLAPPMP